LACTKSVVEDIFPNKARIYGKWWKAEKELDIDNYTISRKRCRAFLSLFHTNCIIKTTKIRLYGLKSLYIAENKAWLEKPITTSKVKLESTTIGISMPPNSFFFREFLGFAICTAHLHRIFPISDVSNSIFTANNISIVFTL
jgi:hypothetical protein